MPGARPPFGYDYIGGEFVVNGDEAAVVRKIYQLYLAGESTYQIAKRLSAESVPTKADKPNALAKRNDYGVWNPSTVKKILKNETYTGYWHYNKSKTVTVNGKKRQEKRPRSEWLAVAIPALIEPTTFQQVQQQLAANRAQQKYPANRFYLLQGMLYCACGLCCACDYRREFLFYRCPIKARQTWQRTCTIRFSVEAAKIEGVVWDVIAKLIANPEKLKTEIKKQRQRQAALLAEMDCQLDAIRVAKADTERRLSLLLDSILDGYPHEILQERQQLLLDKLKHLEIEEAKVNSTLPSVIIVPEHEEKLLALSVRTLDELRNLNFVQKRDTLQLLQVHVAVLDQQRVKVSGILNFDDAVIDIA